MPGISLFAMLTDALSRQQELEKPSGLSAPARIPGRPLAMDTMGGKELCGTERLLLVEDERVVREVAAIILRGRGYTILEAAEGVEALRLAESHTGLGIDLLFTDVVMPLMSGQELAERIRLTLPAIKVLYTSGYTGDVIGEISLQHKCTAFLEKPFTPVELARIVRALLDG